MSVIPRRTFMVVIGSAVGGWALAAPGASGPRQVLLIRHGEEPDRAKSVHLNKRGYARAAALSHLFSGRLPKPDAIFASKSSKASSRSVETVTPLAEALGLRVDDRFADRQYAELARELMTKPAYAGKVVLVCWHHDELPYLALALGVHDQRLRWPSPTYDRIWSLKFEAGGARLEETGQKLLPGDA